MTAVPSGWDPKVNLSQLLCLLSFHDLITGQRELTISLSSQLFILLQLLFSFSAMFSLSILNCNTFSDVVSDLRPHGSA